MPEMEASFRRLNKAIKGKEVGKHTSYANYSEKGMIIERENNLHVYMLDDTYIIVKNSGIDTQELRKKRPFTGGLSDLANFSPQITWNMYYLLKNGRLVDNENEIKDVVKRTTGVSLKAVVDNDVSYNDWFELSAPVGRDMKVFEKGTGDFKIAWDFVQPNEDEIQKQINAIEAESKRVLEDYRENKPEQTLLTADIAKKILLYGSAAKALEVENEKLNHLESVSS